MSESTKRKPRRRKQQAPTPVKSAPAPPAEKNKHQKDEKKKKTEVRVISFTVWRYLKRTRRSNILLQPRLLNGLRKATTRRRDEPVPEPTAKKSKESTPLAQKAIRKLIKRSKNMRYVGFRHLILLLGVFYPKSSSNRLRETQQQGG